MLIGQKGLKRIPYKVKIKILNRDSCEVYIDNWNAFAKVYKNTKEFNVPSYVFGEYAKDPVIIWLRGDKFYYPIIEKIYRGRDISRDRLIFKEVQFKRKPLSILNIWLDEKKSELDSVDGILESDDLIINGKKIESVQIVKGFFSAIINHPPDLTIDGLFKSPELGAKEISIKINPENIEQNFYIFKGNILEHLQKKRDVQREFEERERKAKADSLACIQQKAKEDSLKAVVARQEREQAEKEKRLHRFKKIVSFNGGVER